MFWPKKGIFRDGRSSRTYSYVFGDFSCYADIGEYLKYLLLLSKPGQNGLGRPLNIVLSPYKAEEWHKRPQIGGFPKKFKPFGLDPPPTSGHGTTAQAPLDFRKISYLGYNKLAMSLAHTD